MKKNEWMFQTIHALFFKNVKRDEEIDDIEFETWKSELQRELPYFWKSF